MAPLTARRHCMQNTQEGGSSDLAQVSEGDVPLLNIEEGSLSNFNLDQTKSSGGDEVIHK